MGLALDDFGTAFSSISYVRRFPFDHLKLHISFTPELPHSTRSTLLVEEICHLSNSMGMMSVAEGLTARSNWMRFVASAGSAGRATSFRGRLLAKIVKRFWRLSRRIGRSPLAGDKISTPALADVNLPGSHCTNELLIVISPTAASRLVHSPARCSRVVQRAHGTACCGASLQLSTRRFESLSIGAGPAGHVGSSQGVADPWNRRQAARWGQPIYCRDQVIPVGELRQSVVASIG